MIAKLGTCLLTLPLDDLLVALSVFHVLSVNGVPEEHQALFVPVVPILMVLVRRCVRHFIKKQSVAQSSYHVVLYQALSILESMCYFNDVMVSVGVWCSRDAQSFLSHGVYATLSLFIYHPLCSKDHTAFMYSVSIITYSIFNASEKNVAARVRSDL